MAPANRQTRPATPDDIPAIRGDPRGPRQRRSRDARGHRRAVRAPPRGAPPHAAHRGGRGRRGVRRRRGRRPRRPPGRPVRRAGPAGPGPRPPAARRAVRRRAAPNHLRVRRSARAAPLRAGGDDAALAHPARRGRWVPPGDAGRAGRGRRSPEELAALELAWTGADRGDDHRFWASQADADPFLVLDRDGPVALAIGRARQVSDVRVIDRMHVRPGGGSPARPSSPRSVARTAAPGSSPACSAPARCCRCSWILASASWTATSTWPAIPGSSTQHASSRTRGCSRPAGPGPGPPRRPPGPSA